MSEPLGLRKGGRGGAHVLKKPQRRAVEALSLVEDGVGHSSEREVVADVEWYGSTTLQPGDQEKCIDCRSSMSLRAMAVGTLRAHVRGALSRKPRALYTRHEVLAYKTTTAQYPV
jgi:hypothetical protein